MPEVMCGIAEIHYEVQGQGEPLLLIHGLGSSSQDWEMQLQEFSEHFLVVGVDLRGHGQSSKTPGPYSISLFADDLALFIRGLGFPAVHLLGISLGGMVAFQLALDYPELVSSLVIVNSVPELIAKTAKQRLDYWKRLLVVRLFGLERMGQVLAERFFTEPEQEGLRQIFIQRWAKNHKPSYLASLNAAYGWSVMARLREIQAPTLVIGAEGDYFPNSEKEQYTRLMPNAELIIVKNTRHALPAEKPAEFNRIVLDFLLALS
jgi:pimeloyl-ACP methyl ester carboxylesterase